MVGLTIFFYIFFSVGGKELHSLTPLQLAGFRLHPGPLPEQYRYSMQVQTKRRRKHKKNRHKGSETPATDGKLFFANAFKTLILLFCDLKQTKLLNGFDHEFRFTYILTHFVRLKIIKFI